MNEDVPEELLYDFKFREDSMSDDNEDQLWYKVGRILDFKEAEDAKVDIKEQIKHLPDVLKDNANKLIGILHARIHTYTVINYYEEKSQDYDKVLNIFVRANSAGKALEYSDLLLSTATAKWENLDARKEINNFTDEINRIGVGYNFGKDFILKSSLFLTKELPIQYRVKNFTKSNLLKIEANWDEIKTYLTTTVRLISKYGFSSKNLVAPLSLLSISLFLFQKGNKSFDKSSERIEVNNQIAIRKWLIFVLLKNAFGSATDTKLKNIRDIILNKEKSDSFPTEEINKKLEIELIFSDNEIEEVLSFSYQSKYTYLALSLLYPDRDWKDAVFHEDHIFPASEFATRKLKKREYDNRKIEFYLSHYNTLANLQLLTDSENLSKNATPFEDWLSTRDIAFKKRHLIPDLPDYNFDRFEEFIRNRKVKIIEAFTKQV